jgi:hypothetical protein
MCFEAFTENDLLREAAWVILCTGYKESIRHLGVQLEKDARFIGYWAEFRIARFHSLPKVQGDMRHVFKGQGWVGS